MTTEHEYVLRLLPTIAQMQAQLGSWRLLLDELLDRRHHLSARSVNAYQSGLTDLRRRLGLAQAQVDEYAHPTRPREAWATFRARIRDDWRALEASFLRVMR